MAKVAVVTGSNKGIGLAIVRGLCKQFKGDVYLTSRDEKRGKEAVELLKAEGLNPKFHQLDILDQNSITALKDFVVEKYKGLDILVNNAGIAYKAADTTPFATQADVTMKTNYTALINVTNTLLPIMKDDSRIIHVSSTVSTMFLQRCSDDRKKQILAASSVDNVTALMNEFVKDAKEGKHKERGWADWAYGATKLGVTVVTSIQQANIDKERPNSKIVVNACCPGYVDTDMSSHKGKLSPDQGAETPLYLALLPGNDIKGCFLSKKTVFKWREGQYPSF